MVEILLYMLQSKLFYRGIGFILHTDRNISIPDKNANRHFNSVPPLLLHCLYLEFLHYPIAFGSCVLPTCKLLLSEELPQWRREKGTIESDLQHTRPLPPILTRQFLQRETVCKKEEYKIYKELKSSFKKEYKQLMGGQNVFLSL